MRPGYVAIGLLVGIFGAGGITACGGDDDSPIVPVQTQTAPTDQLDKDGFIDEADQICEEANTTIANLAESTVADPSTVIAEELEVVEGELDQIDSLGAPSEDEATLADFIDGLEQLADNLDKQQLAAERDDTTSLTELQTEETTIQSELTLAAEDYGFKECGQEGEVTTTGTGAGAGGGAGADTGVAPAPVEPAPATPAPVEPAPAPAPARRPRLRPRPHPRAAAPEARRPATRAASVPGVAPPPERRYAACSDHAPYSRAY